MLVNEYAEVGGNIAQGILGGNGTGGMIKGVGSALVGTLAIATGVSNAYTKIKTGERGVRESLGRTQLPKDAWFRDRKKGDYYGILGPGIHWHTPFTHTIHLTSVLDHNPDFTPVIVVDEAKRYHELTGNITWAVNDDPDSIYRSLFALAGGYDVLGSTVINNFSSGLHKTGTNKPAEWLDNSEVVIQDIKAATFDQLDSYGVSLKSVGLTSTALTREEVLGRRLVEAAEKGPDWHVMLAGQLAIADHTSEAQRMGFPHSA